MPRSVPSRLPTPHLLKAKRAFDGDARALAVYLSKLGQQVNATVWDALRHDEGDEGRCAQVRQSTVLSKPWGGSPAVGDSLGRALCAMAVVGYLKPCDDE